MSDNKRTLVKHRDDADGWNVIYRSYVIGSGTYAECMTLAAQPLYAVFDLQMCAQIGRAYKTRSGARKRRDELDRRHGAIRYIVKEV